MTYKELLTQIRRFNSQDLAMRVKDEEGNCYELGYTFDCSPQQTKMGFYEGSPMLVRMPKEHL